MFFNTRFWPVVAIYFLQILKEIFLSRVRGRPSKSSVRPKGFNQVTRNREVQSRLFAQPGESSRNGVLHQTKSLFAVETPAPRQSSVYRIDAFCVVIMRKGSPPYKTLGALSALWHAHSIPHTHYLFLCSVSCGVSLRKSIEIILKTFVPYICAFGLNLYVIRCNI